MGKPTVAIRANSEEQKEKWKNAVEESEEYDSLSHLIRRAVEREIGGAYGGGGGGAEARHDEAERIAEVLTTVQRVETRVEELDETLEAMSRTMGTEYDSEATTEVWRALPEGAARATTPDGVAAGTPYDADEVRVVLEQLHESTGAVKRIEFDAIESGEGTSTVQHQGREIQIEAAPKAVRKRSPLWFKSQ